MNRKLKRFIVISTPITVFLLTVLTWIYIAKPFLIAFVKSEIPRINASQNILDLTIDDIDISLLTLQLRAKTVKIDFKDKTFNLSPLIIDNIKAQLDIFNLVIGRINISKINIIGAHLKVELKNDNDEQTPLPKIPVETIFTILKVIPVDHLIITESEVNLHNERLKNESLISINKASISNLKKEIVIIVNNLNVRISDQTNAPVNSELSLVASATPENLKIKNSKITILDSTLEIEAQFNKYKDLFNAPQGKVSVKSEINLQDVRSLALVLFPQKSRIPSVSGKISSHGHLDFNSFNDINGAVAVNTSQVVLDHFKLGQAELTTTISKNQILINEINLEHLAGAVKLKNLKIEQKSPYHFNSKIDFANFDLYKLFQSLGLSDIPAGFNAEGSAICEGLLSPTPLITCSINTDLKEAWVKSSVKEKGHILKIKKGRITAETKISKEKMSYHADIEIGNSSTGTSSGEVVFKDGFSISYESSNLDFADIESLADLDLKGIIKIIGTTSGDSSHGLIKASVSASNAEIEKFRLGSFSSSLNYKDGQLLFSNLIGIVGKSDLAGVLNFNFNKPELNAEINSSELHGEDILFILNKKFNLPFELTGSGKAHIRLDGPFDFWKLKYTLDTELLQGGIAGEHFEKLNANIVANGSLIEFKNFTLKKFKTVLSLDGSINTQTSEPQFDLKIRTNPLQLEESDHIIKYAPSISGIGYSDGTITGPLSAPSFVSNVTLKQVSYEKIDYPNSQGKFKIDKKYLYFNGQFFGRQIQTDIAWPWNENDGFNAKVLVQDLNPLFLLPLISLPQPGSDFYSRLNAEVDLTSKNRSFSLADGFIKVSDFVLLRGNQSLRLTKPSRLHFKSGLNHLEDFELKGEDSFLKLTMDKSSINRVKLNIESDLQLRMFHFLVPFAQSLTGNLVLNSQLIFKDSNFELLGDGEITDGSVSLKGFPQAIENINAPIEFSKSKIILSDITGQMGPSDVTGLGHIDIIGPQNIIVNLKAVADNVQLNFPNKILTQGKANVLFSGSWLPYNLKIDYKVNQGLIENDFEQDPKQSQSLKASSFLPPQQAQLLSPSLTIDVNIDLTNGILIKNKLLEGEAKGSIQVQGSAEQPILLGKINIQQGSKLIFKDKPFEIQNAIVQFQGTKEINPEIYISANSRVSDYDISLLVQGLAKNLTITPSSQPPLSTNDIFTLLALGVTNQANQNLSSDTQQRQTGLEVLAAISNQSQLNKKIQERLGLTVQLAPSVDSTKNIAVPKVVVSKKISKKVNASYSKPFTGNDQNQEVKLQYLYNNNISFQLNYQNKETTQQEQITNSSNINKSILGLDLEFRDEFK